MTEIGQKQSDLGAIFTAFLKNANRELLASYPPP
jgi:hypothetical protein